MQYEIDRDASILDQIMPESEEQMDLVEGIPKKDDEKYDMTLNLHYCNDCNTDDTLTLSMFFQLFFRYNFRHYFTYR